MGTRISRLLASGTEEVQPTEIANTQGRNGGSMQIVHPNGLYFGPHFVLRSQVTPENNPLAESRPNEAVPEFPYSIQQLYSSRSQGAHAAEITANCSTLQCLVNLKRGSLRLLPLNSSNEDSKPESSICKYGLQFEFDCSVPCTLHIFFFIKDVPFPLTGELSHLTKFPHLSPISYAFPKGLKQKFVLEDGEAVDLISYIKQDAQDIILEPSLKHDFENEVTPIASLQDEILDVRLQVEGQPSEDLQTETSVYYPIVILLNSKTEEKTVNAQATYITLAGGRSKPLEAKVIKQKVVIDGVSYILQEIYGLADSGVQEAQESCYDNLSSRECVICMSEPKDTTVLPCRHLCLCSGCAEVLRFQTQKCPICRQPFHSLLRISTTPPNGKKVGSIEDMANVEKGREILHLNALSPEERDI